MLYYAKKDIMDELRHVQLQTTHHMHAIVQCADLSKRMPINVMMMWVKMTYIFLSVIFIFF